MRRLLLTTVILLLSNVEAGFGRDFLAVVDQNGKLVRGDEGTVSATRSGPGQYDVTFNEPVDGCSYTAAIGDTANALVYSPGVIFTAGGHAGQTDVAVETRNPGGALADYPFHLSVNCTSNYAVVNAGGVLVRGDAQGSSRLGVGQYEVVFPVPVTACAYTATIGDPANGAPPTSGIVFTASGHNGSNDVYVQTKSMAGALTDYPFHLTAVCASNFAVVSHAGALLRGDAKGVTRLGAGRYEVTFGVPQNLCAFTATIGDPANGAVSGAGMVFSAGGHSGPNGVYIETKNMGGGLTDFPFHIRSTCPAVWGFSDLHTHPASHLAFGGDADGVNGLFWGKPAHDGAMDVATSSSDANLAADMPPCPTASVGPFGLGFIHNNTAGPNFITLMTDAQVVSTLDNTSPGWTHQSQGAPAFQDSNGVAGWPNALTVDHQVMHINSIQRAFFGGLRLMFASVTNNELITKVWNQGFNLGGNPMPTHDASFDYQSAVTQLTYITNLVNANSDWMQIVKTPAEARAAVNSNPPKLAVVLSLEMDSLSLQQIQSLVQQFGVAHVIAVHLSDSAFGGTAVYSDTFNGQSYFVNGSYYGTADDAGVNFRLASSPAVILPVTLSNVFHLSTGSVAMIDIALAGAVALGPTVVAVIAAAALGVQVLPTGALGYMPSLPSAAPLQTPGQVNSKDLDQNQFSALMNMGLMLDVAHMGQKTAGTALSMAQKYHYPLMDSHTGIRCDGQVPAEAVQCSVFDDGYTNLSSPSDAVYIKTGLQACTPDNTSTGDCHKWFGRCSTVSTKHPVYFHVFDDGYQNDGGQSDAVYIHQENPLKACIPGPGDGTCRKWFGRGVTDDGRQVTCSVFDDGYTNEVGPSDAIYSLGILGQQNLDACIPNATTTGLCRKWFGRCQAAPNQVPSACMTPFGHPPNPATAGGMPVNERSLPVSHLQIIKQLGGVIGLGMVPSVSGNTPDQDPVTTWINNYSIAWSLMSGKGVAIGTDANGLSPLLQRDTIPTSPNITEYSINVASKFGCPAGCPTLAQYQLGTKGHLYDFQKDGIANYGMLADFVQAASLPRPAASLPAPTAQITALFHSAEDTIEMWERSITAARGVPAPEAVQCSVFDDGYTNLSSSSDAVYIKTGLQACTPDNTSTGNCHKWFGRCSTVSTKHPVYFHVFDDGYQNDGGQSDAVYIHQENPLKACIPGPGNGTCRKWFGRGVTDDGRQVICSVFDDGYTNQVGPSDAIYSLGILGQQNLEACIPGATTTGLCRKWFGRCLAFAGQ